MKKLRIILQFNIKFLFFSLFIVIYVLISTKFIKHNSNFNDNISFISGKISSYNIDGNKLSITLKCNTEKIIANYYISTLKEKENLGNSLCLGCTINLNGIFENPTNNTIPNTFNYGKYLYNKGIYKTFKIEKYGIYNDNNLLMKIKDYFYKRVDAMENSDYLKIFILGDKTELDTNMYEKYQINGVAHLLAISGMHIGVIVSCLNKLLKFLQPKSKTAFIFLILFFFAFITNFSASILRAIIFFLLKNIKKIYKLRIHDIKLLFITAYIILILNPFMLYDIGFIYSFSITMGILIFSNKLSGYYIIKIFKLSFISSLISLPITINLNYEINLLSIFANIIFVPFVSFIIFPLSIFYFIFPFLENIFNFFITIFEMLNNLFYLISLNIVIPKMSIFFIVLYYFIVLGIFKHNKYILYLIILLLIIKFVPKIDSNFYIFFLDVGQGDSILMITPYQKEVILIDSGGRITYENDAWERRNRIYNISDNTIDLLKSMGITQIALFISTHGDYDHMGESINLVNNFKVEKVVFNCGEFNELEQDLIKTLDQKKIPYYSCIKELNIDNNKLYFLNGGDYGNENDNSSVIYAVLNNRKFLFMGDAGIDVEEDLIKKYNLQNIDVLKVGHHGSKTSSSESFINEINPKYSIISVGKNNRYGHPNDNVLDNLENSIIYRTDQDGSVMFKIKNNKLKIEACAP